MKRKLLLILVLFMTITIFGLSKKNIKLKVAVIYSTSGKGDKSLNDFTYSGLLKSKKEFDIEVREVIQKTSPVDIENQIRALSKNGEYDLIIGLTREVRFGIEKVIKDYPKQKFVITHEKLSKNYDNVATILFKENEGGILAGALAGLMTKSNSVAFIGYDLDIAKEYIKGFREGLSLTNKKAVVNISSINSKDSPYFDVDVAKKTADILIKKKRADVIFHIAGYSGLGIINSARENKTFVISSMQNDDRVAIGTVLTSILTDLEEPIYQIIRKTAQGNFKGDNYYYGIKEKAIKTTDFSVTKDIIGNENLKKIEEIKAKY